MLISYYSERLVNETWLSIVSGWFGRIYFCFTCCVLADRKQTMANFILNTISPKIKLIILKLKISVVFLFVFSDVRDTFWNMVVFLSAVIASFIIQQYDLQLHLKLILMVISLFVNLVFCVSVVLNVCFTFSNFKFEMSLSILSLQPCMVV